MHLTQSVDHVDESIPLDVAIPSALPLSLSDSWCALYHLVHFERQYTQNFRRAFVPIVTSTPSPSTSHVAHPFSFNRNTLSHDIVAPLTQHYPSVKRFNKTSAIKTQDAARRTGKQSLSEGSWPGTPNVFSSTNSLKLTMCCNTISAGLIHRPDHPHTTRLTPWPQATRSLHRTRGG